ncbi:uncharacterized protein LOC128205870 [Mya arenaria]|uniref:uncharacterized protein LOC128205870 n=1 Tax=Mya arenaria TaxID=6604 RepID=UPI0022E38104|nr:uncharacterized protein LOC128205870 [Mya arenaria]XP_052763857.1 uncharacterized protein LOC128205870 [Mya arenaria]XP_052763858.1 uncharacterized protein LOC128205870 [Mya arenaria]XP_052763859.1 uncharacterized protein LOC128205870 [Mya arenaria]XP_052763860.1 uncharacterized protein LOC128205870 [Mya arenaria]
MACKMLSDKEQNQNFCKTHSLLVDIGGDILRDLIEYKLKLSSLDIITHLKDPATVGIINSLEKKKVLFKTQVKLLTSANPDLKEMDISLLTKVLLDTKIKLTKNEKDLVEGIRNKRNQLGHAVRAELVDLSLFEKTKITFGDLVKSLDKKLAETVNERVSLLEKRELVSPVSNLSVVQLRCEELQMKLVSSDEKPAEDILSLRKYGIALYMRNIARHLDGDVFLQALKSEGVIYDTTKRKLQAITDREEQAAQLVLYVLDDIGENVLKFCKCLRDQNSLLADQVEFSSSEGAETGKKLAEIEGEEIIKILTTTFEKVESKSVSSEDVHVQVERCRKCTVKFSVVKTCIEKAFEVELSGNNSRVHGIWWKHEDIRDEYEKQTITDSGANERVFEMDSEEFAEYLFKAMERNRKGTGPIFKSVIEEQSISADVFASLDKEELKELFTEALEKEGIKYGFGINSKLKNVQTDIKTQKLNYEPFNETSVNLRKFGTSGSDLRYEKGKVANTTRDLVDPVRYFMYPKFTRDYKMENVAKELVRFIQACLNGRQSGTFHYGIAEVDNSAGQVRGIDTELIDFHSFQHVLKNSLSRCFERNILSTVNQCIFPEQIVWVGDDKKNVVLEVDVDPFSGLQVDTCIKTKFPAHGHTVDKYFIYVRRPNCELECLVESKACSDSTVTILRQSLEARKRLESTYSDEITKSSMRLADLVHRVTGGYEYVTQNFCPFIIGGSLPENPRREQIIQSIHEMRHAFISSLVVFDFDKSTEVLKTVEGTEQYFEVGLAETVGNRKRRDSGVDIRKWNYWLYCNGNDELDRRDMDVTEWYQERQEGVKLIMDGFKQKVPADTSLFIILVYSKLVKSDPMYDFVRECTLHNRDSTIIVSESEENIKNLRLDIAGSVGEQRVSEIIFAGCEWKDVSIALAPKFKQNPDTVCQLPNSNGVIIDMTRREIQNLHITDIEIISGDQCRSSIESMTDTERRDFSQMQQELFFRGNEVTWWNFAFNRHVCERDHFETHKQKIYHRLNEVDQRIKVHEIYHHPGAGGTTLAKNLLWHFSQFKRGDKPTENVYRCGVLKTVRELETVKQAESFRTFKDTPDRAKPILLMLDNGSDESYNILKTELEETAYKSGYSTRIGHPYCLLIIVKRMPISVKNNPKLPVLSHGLSQTERDWFDSKNREMEGEHFEDHLQTLIAFNLMRKDFSEKYVTDITSHVMNELHDNEKTVLQNLAILTYFEPDGWVPRSVFNEVMQIEESTPFRYTIKDCLEVNRPVGLRRTISYTSSQSRPWGHHDALSLFLKEKSMLDRMPNCVLVISPLLAKEVLKQCQEAKSCTFEVLVDQLLDVMARHTDEQNDLSKQFVQNVCNLFKERKVYVNEKGETSKKMFSDLIHYIQNEEPISRGDRKNAGFSVLRLMQRCFKISKNPFVAQQLARYYKHIKEFTNAIKAIQSAIELNPKNPFLYDTFGQIYRSMLEQMTDTKTCMPVSDALQAIEYTELAVSKFQEAQKLSVEYECDLSSFGMEVITVLQFLESIGKIKDVDVSHEQIEQYLNNEDISVLAKLEPQMKIFQRGEAFQIHVEESLRHLEYYESIMTEKVYQVKGSNNAKLLLNTRQRFERFYSCSKEPSFKYKYGPTFKCVQEAFKIRTDKRDLLNHVQMARSQFEEDNIDVYNLLFFVGCKILEFSHEWEKKAHDARILEFRDAQKYSRILVEIQHKNKRPFIEGYLYYAILHWPTRDRRMTSTETFNGESFKNYLEEWQRKFEEMFPIRTKKDVPSQRQRVKTYFTLGKQGPGEDIVDQALVRTKWRKETEIKEGRTRIETMEDDIFNHKIGKQVFARLEGVVDPDGIYVHHKMQCSNSLRRYVEIPICLRRRYDSLANRKITFVLGFRWNGPVAFDPKEQGVCRANKNKTAEGVDDSPPSSLENEATDDMPTSKSAVETGARPKIKPAQVTEKVQKPRNISTRTKSVTESIWNSEKRNLTIQKTESKKVYNRNSMLGNQAKQNSSSSDFKTGTSGLDEFESPSDSKEPQFEDNDCEGGWETVSHNKKGNKKKH